MDMTQLNDLFLEAAETERKLPAAIRKQKLSSWPDHVQDWFGYGYHAAETPRLTATLEQVSRLDYAIELGITGMDVEDRKLVCGCCTLGSVS